VLIRTGRWSALSTKHDVRYTGNKSFLFIRMSKTSGVAEGLNVLEVGKSGP